MKVMITDYQYEHVENERKLIEGAGFELIARRNSLKEEIIDIGKNVDALITQYCEIDAETIGFMNNCKLIVKYGVGVNNIDVQAASQKGIYVCNVPDYGIDEVSNHAIALLFALNRKLKTFSSSIKRGEWSYDSAVPLRRFAGSTLGLVGFGRIPQSIANKMKGFDLQILGYDPYCSRERMEEFGVEKVDLNLLLRKSDNISIHCPYTTETHHMFSTDEFRAMRPTAFLINTARGSIVDEKALIEALRSGEISGAGLDVFEQEPLRPDSPLLRMENVIVTPHSAWYSEEAIRTLQKSVAEEVVRVLSENDPLHPCNVKELRECGYLR
jgi:D-3-phosphoglycerate dehydrogenase